MLRMKKEKTKSKEEILEASKFTKEQLVSSRLFRNNKDVLNALIKDNEELTIEQAKERIENFRKGKVI